MFGKNKELGVTNPAGLFFLLLLFFFFALLLGCGKRSHIYKMNGGRLLLYVPRRFHSSTLVSVLGHFARRRNGTGHS